MRVLGIDTATWTASVGICDGERLLSERSLATSGTHGFSLVPMVDEALQEAGLRAADLGGIAVSIGPGSFTGLRIGLAAAKGLAFAAGVPIVGVRTLLALAVAAEVSDGLVCPLLDARKGEVYAALVEMRAGRGEWAHGEVVVALDRWLSLVGDRDCTFIGDAVGLVSARGGAASGWHLRSFDRFHPRGAIVARLGAERLRAGDPDDLASLEPLYVRPSEAELKAPQL